MKCKIKYNLRDRKEYTEVHVAKANKIRVVMNYLLQDQRKWITTPVLSLQPVATARPCFAQLTIFFTGTLRNVSQLTPREKILPINLLNSSKQNC